MKSLPLPVRVAAGLVATAVEETRELPRRLVGLPVTVVSQVLQLTMRVQQQITELAIKGDEALAALEVRCTTHPIRLALWAGSGPVTVFATYASLAPRQDIGSDGVVVEVPGPLEAAFQGAYGQKLQPFGLAVVDEAHRTSGDAAKPWAAIHDQTRIPAARRPRTFPAIPAWPSSLSSRRDRGRRNVSFLCLPRARSIACSPNSVQATGLTAS